MISFLPPESPAPVLDEQFKVASAYNTLVEQTFKDAILTACDGVMPPDEEITRRGLIAIKPDGTKYLLWDHGPLGVGEKPDFSKCIAAVEPPFKQKP